MNWLSRTGLSLGTLVAPLLGGAFLFSLVGAAVCTPPFNDRLGWVVAVDHGRHVQALHNAPSFGTPVRVRWRKRN